jgi:hypothetical protein
VVRHESKCSADTNSKTPFVIYQGPSSVMQRDLDLERELMPMCWQEGAHFCSLSNTFPREGYFCGTYVWSFNTTRYCTLAGSCGETCQSDGVQILITFLFALLLFSFINILHSFNLIFLCGCRISGVCSDSTGICESRHGHSSYKQRTCSYRFRSFSYHTPNTLVLCPWPLYCNSRNSNAFCNRVILRRSPARTSETI